VRNCRLGPHQLEDEEAWIANYRAVQEDRLNHVGEFLERTKGRES
jgi:hypothetical protein